MALSRVVFAENGVVASEQPLASLAGLEVLKKGGNAVDAAVATSFALSVTFQCANGLGGDFFAMVYVAKTGRIHCLNSSGWAPSGLTLDFLKSKGETDIPLYGPLSVTIPGAVAGFWALHKKLGKLEFKSLPSAAAAYARKGFPASASLCRSITSNLPSFTSGAKRIFAPTGEPPMPGDIIRQAELARVIGEVARGGADAFYRGSAAEEIAQVLSDSGVDVKKSDLSAFKPEWVEPLRLEYRGTTVYEMPPNTMGAACLLMLNYLSQRDMSKTKPLSWERVNLTMKAAELAYRRRDEALGDPRFSEIDLGRFMRLDAEEAKPGGTEVKTGDTTAYSIVDSEGNVVSAIQSLFHHFGSRVFVDGCGIMLNNRASGFSTSGPNALEPRKRPLHTLSSMLLARGGEPKVAIGCSGGDFRPMQHTLFVTNLVDYSMTLEQAIDHARFLRSGKGSMLVEGGYGDLGGLQYEIQRLTHPGPTGVCQGAEVLAESKKAVCDVRGDGLPMGF
ncbi:MAG TPA: gamma-glutamyltransferase family protein [Nitrososphaerales archaeon]|nr:gamma-glutamyltransferase family protein [Nitrososphaerales archaeon]